MRYPWDNYAPQADLFTLPWELYDLHRDWTQTEDLAAKNPNKLREMQAGIGPI